MFLIHYNNYPVIRIEGKRVIMNPIYEINQLADQLPLSVVQDLHKRIADWLADGGNYDDPYMFQQLRYAQNVARRMQEK